MIQKRAAATANAKILLKGFHWFVRQFTAQIIQQRVFSENSVCRAPTELAFIERSVFRKDVNSDNVSHLEDCVKKKLMLFLIFKREFGD